MKLSLMGLVLRSGKKEYDDGGWWSWAHVVEVGAAEGEISLGSREVDLTTWPKMKPMQMDLEVGCRVKDFGNRIAVLEAGEVK